MTDAKGDAVMEDVNNEGNASEAMETSSALAPAQKKAVDDAFQELFGYAWGTSFELPTSNIKPRQPALRALKNGTISDQDAKATLLVQILGPIRAAHILKTGASMRRRVPLAKRQIALPKSSTQPSSSTGNAAATQQQSSSSTPQFETKLFAGKKIQVAVQPGGSSKTTGGKNSGGGIDSVLQQIAGPSKISTVAKTSADWDSFKTETGLEAELEKKAQGKDAYLVKQDFLSRVDTRKFELERSERDKERAKRGT